jgi:hypothetical protein
MAIRVLIVLDGTYRFDEPADTTDFTYTSLVNALTAAGMQVTKAHRGTDATADISSFNFATSVNLLDFDVVWLIGFEGRNVSSGTSIANALGDVQRAAIARFQDAGGGIFATGDHDSIGSNMCGYLLRVRAMRAWYGTGDPISPMPAGFPRNFPPLVGATETRADTTRKNPLGDYDRNNDGTDEQFVWFENQSDSIPQPLTPTTNPAHPILRTRGRDIVVYPDHMHEGNALGEVPGFDYEQTLTIDGQPFVEFPAVDGHRELPNVIATGQTLANASRNADDDTALDTQLSTPTTVNSLSVYDGRAVGVGRIVTGSTFHHYVDINLTGDTDINTPERRARTGPDAEKGQGFGFAGAESTFSDIKTVFVNITQWLARPRPALQLVLERSTFSQDEATANPNFDGAVLVIVDGLKPSQFPGGGITTLSPSGAQLASWAPTFTPGEVSITPTGVGSDDPSLPDRLQRITFTYRLTIVGGAAAFAFPEPFRTLTVTTNLSSSAVSAALTDSAPVQLVKSANPFMLDLADGATKTWLSSDVRVFRVVAGETRLGQTLPSNATRAQALTYIQNVVNGMTVAGFTGLTLDQSASALSPFPTTNGGVKVYNFAVARVRLNSTVAAANDVRVFFRIFTSQTTAALTYRESAGAPIEGYRRTTGANPIALPGMNAGGTEWLSFPMFANTRAGTPETQSDSENVKNILASEHDKFFGALLDTNLDGNYLPPTPAGGSPTDLPTLLTGEHQCIVAQIEHAGTPIPSGANPATSDKLAQRNIALSEVANPGLNASRVAMHTFQLEATPHAITEGLPPDDVLLEWNRGKTGVPDGASVRIFIPTWNTAEVLELAERFYPRHELRALDAHTISVPGGGIRYVPVPRSFQRQTGVIAVELPLGIQKGQRFDVAVRQITNRSRGNKPPTRTELISLKKAEELLEGLPNGPKHRARKGGVFSLGDRKTLITDLRVLDAAGDHAILVEHPDPKKVLEAQRSALSWRETIGAFQLGVPVSTKDDMLVYHLRLLSLFRWRLESLRPNHRWYETLRYYVDRLADKVRALGGDPFTVPPTRDGVIPLPPGKDPGKGGDESAGGGSGGAPGTADDPWFEPKDDDWLAETNGLVSPDRAKPATFSGKVSGLLYDHFGDFEGFTLEAYDGSQYRFFSRETAIHDLAKAAWAERHVVTVITVSEKSRRVRRLLIRGYA